MLSQLSYQATWRQMVNCEFVTYLMIWIYMKIKLHMWRVDQHEWNLWSLQCAINFSSWKSNLKQLKKYQEKSDWNTLCNRAVFNWVSKVILQLLWFCIATICDWLKNLAPFSQPISSKTKTNRDLPARDFLRLATATCICFDLWLVHWIVYDCCDWSE